MSDQILVEPISRTEEVLELERVLFDLRINADVDSCVAVGPLRKYRVRPNGTTKFDKFEAAAEDIALRMRSVSTPVARRVPGTDTIGLDMMFGPHPIVSFEKIAKKLMEEGRKFSELEVLLGATEIETPLIIDIAKTPHLLVAGTTGSGKSMCLHSIINSLTGALGERDVRLYMIDPKQVEFSRYTDLKQLDFDIATTLDEASAVMLEVEHRMRERLAVLSKAGAKDIGEFRAAGKGPRMPYVVVLIDEIADLVRGRKSKFLNSLISVAEKGRAAGIHLIACTQHPSREVISGPIKANFPSKIAFKVTTGTHSKVILDHVGAQHLVGKGDGLLVDGETSMLRFQGALVELIQSTPKLIGAAKKSGVFGKLASRFR